MDTLWTVYACTNVTDVRYRCGQKKKKKLEGTSGLGLIQMRYKYDLFSLQSCKTSNLKLIDLSNAGYFHVFGSFLCVSHHLLQTLDERTHEHVVLKFLLLVGAETIAAQFRQAMVVKGANCLWRDE